MVPVLCQLLHYSNYACRQSLQAGAYVKHESYALQEDFLGSSNKKHATSKLQLSSWISIPYTLPIQYPLNLTAVAFCHMLTVGLVHLHRANGVGFDYWATAVVTLSTIYLHALSTQSHIIQLLA